MSEQNGEYVVLGLDIGGANTKAAVVEIDTGFVKRIEASMEYFPLWKAGKENLPTVLSGLKADLLDAGKLCAVGVTMTAELSDVYQTKTEGVNHILDCVGQVFQDTRIYVLDCDGSLRSVHEARGNPLKVAAANWAATAWLVSIWVKDCIIIDVGSTTTSIIPVVDGKAIAEGKNDLMKLMNGELVYTGALRTNVAAIVNPIPVRDSPARVSSELFALSGDVHIILGNIREEDYTTETADGRGKTRAEAEARLARVVCADRDMLAKEEIKEMAEYIYQAQVKQITEALNQIYNRVKHLKGDIPAVVTGLGRKFLAEKAAAEAGFKRIIDLSEFVGGNELANMMPSTGVALMVATSLEGKALKWKP